MPTNPPPDPTSGPNRPTNPNQHPPGASPNPPSPPSVSPNASTSPTPPRPSATPDPSFLRLATHPLLFRAYLLSKIPAALFSGIRIRELDSTHSLVSVPYKWFTRNPFRSTYFACLAMAAEMSTGILVMSRIYKQQPAVSMLVVAMESSFTKKATGPTTFRCSDGLEIYETIQKAVATGEAQSIKARSIGTNPQGETVAEFFITWSFKVKARK